MGTTGSTVKTVLVAQVQYRTKNTGRTITAETRIIEPFAISLELPPLVRFGIFCFLSLVGAEQLFFCCVFPFLKYHR